MQKEREAMLEEGVWREGKEEGGGSTAKERVAGCLSRGTVKEADVYGGKGCVGVEGRGVWRERGRRGRCATPQHSTPSTPRHSFTPASPSYTSR